MKVYKIRDKDTGLYALGGIYGGWNKTGKSWSTIGNLKGHLAMFEGSYNKYSNAEVVEIEVNYDECNKYDIDKDLKILINDGY